MDIVQAMLGDSAGAVALLLLGVALVACGADACWLRLSRTSPEKARAPRRW